MKSIVLFAMMGMMAVPLSASAMAEKSDSEKSQNQGRLVKHGVVVEFEALPKAEGELMEGQLADIRFRITSEATGEPVKGVTPGVWMDMGQVIQAKADAEQKSCKDKIGLYLKGVVGIRPMIDLNSYYVLVMNSDPSISVVDPLVSMVGKTSTLAKIPLKATGLDWVRSADEKRLYVSMPEVNQIAVVDNDSFKVIANIDTGDNPTRVALQPDGRYLWVGNDAKQDGDGGVSVIDTETMQRVVDINTGAGHHEIAFADDSRYAFVSNRNQGDVTVIDVQSRKITKRLKTGPLPIALVYSSLAQMLYVADAKQGTVSVVDTKRHEVVTTITLKPGLGPLRFTEDGRWAMTVNPGENKAYVIDAAVNQLVHTIDVNDQPFQITFSRAFAYIRALGSERVTMVNLATLGEGKKPIVQHFSAGSSAPKLAGNLPLADSMSQAASEAAIFIVNPTDNTTYFYMEGMNAPSSNYKVYGSKARAVTVIDRSLKEVEPGVYQARVKIPAAGRYDVAFQLDTPNLLHCFSAEAKPDPNISHEVRTVGIEFLSEKRRIQTGESAKFQFRLLDPASGHPRTGLRDVSALYFRAPGIDRKEVMAQELGEGIYEVTLPLKRAGAYYLYVAVPSAKIKYSDMPYFTFMADTHVGDREQSDSAKVSLNAGQR